jgi:hypothetical protein
VINGSLWQPPVDLRLLSRCAFSSSPPVTFGSENCSPATSSPARAARSGLGNLSGPVACRTAAAYGGEGHSRGPFSGTMHTASPAAGFANDGFRSLFPPAVLGGRLRGSTVKSARQAAVLVDRQLMRDQRQLPCQSQFDGILGPASTREIIRPTHASCVSILFAPRSEHRKSGNSPNTSRNHSLKGSVLFEAGRRLQGADHDIC